MTTRFPVRRGLLELAVILIGGVFILLGSIPSFRASILAFHKKRMLAGKHRTNANSWVAEKTDPGKCWLSANKYAGTQRSA